NSPSVAWRTVMPLLRRALGGLQGLLHRTRQDAELDQELRAFVESGVDHKMRSGMGREDATRAVRLELGSAAAVKDRVRDAGWESVLGSVWQDVRYGGRMLRRSPAFSAIAISILAVGIGGNTAIFSLINAVMLRELPVRDPAQLVELLTRYPGEPRMNNFG
ncbi:MAG TPA: permease prefix domain 1-containing protein, partial [Vicinamibacterales bacterium]|nr:permease prefix domain 1-containing protein [Vicinamibacterales bacterium]